MGNRDDKGSRIRVPPHNLEAEQYLVGAMLSEPDCIASIQTVLEPDDFYREAHLHIVKSVFKLKEKTTLVTVSEDLKRQDLFEKCGGLDYFGEIVMVTGGSAAWEYHAEIVRSLSERRKIIQACQVASEACFKGWMENEEIVADLKGQLKFSGQGGRFYHGSDEVIKEVFKETEKRAKEGVNWVGVRTGFYNIDKNLNGLENKSTVYLAARPSMGKTALALNIAENVGMSQDGSIPFFSLESDRQKLMRRRWARQSRVFLTRIRTGNIEESQWKDLIDAANEISKSPILMIDHPRFKAVENMMALVEVIAREGPVSMIVVDHIQRMRTKRKTQSRHHELSYVSEEISTMAKEVGVPVLILCQLSRKIEERPLKRQVPQLSDLKESGDLEQNADQVWGMWRKSKEAERTRLECLKGRDTGTWITWLEFDRMIQRFKDGDDTQMLPFDNGEKEDFDL